MKSASDEAGSFVPTFQFGKLEIHKVFLRFPNFNLGAKSLTLVYRDLIIGYLERRELEEMGILLRSVEHTGITRQNGEILNFCGSEFQRNEPDGFAVSARLLCVIE